MFAMQLFQHFTIMTTFIYIMSIVIYINLYENSLLDKTGLLVYRSATHTRSSKVYFCINKLKQLALLKGMPKLKYYTIVILIYCFSRQRFTKFRQSSDSEDENVDFISVLESIVKVFNTLFPQFQRLSASIL
jgi:hypothetical protein